MTWKGGDELDLPRRKKIRLEAYDYSSCGAYFVTICIANRNTLLWNVGADTIRPHESLSPYGEIVETAINQIPTHYDNIIVDQYCIMPDHVHMIIFITPSENGRIVSASTLSMVIGSMKRWVSKQIGFPIWQKLFNDRIIRNEESYREVWQYIDENPLNRTDDYVVQ
jgi:REP element-mobilizing transposase RayT